MAFGVWITHDIDHIRVREHYLRDLFLFRAMVVSGLELIKGRKSICEHARFKLGLFNPNSWYCFDEWIKLEKKHKIPSTWFFAVNRGRSLSYNLKEIEPVVKLLKKNGFDLGLHGQAVNDEKEIRREYELFNKIAGENPKGIRMHYLRMTKETLAQISELYVYDSSLMVDKLEPPKKSLHLVEVPIHIMDTYLFSPLKGNMTLKQAQEQTLKMLKQAKRKKTVLVFDIHPHHLSPMFPRYRDYIYWLYDHLKEEKIKKYDVMELVKEYA